MILFYNKYGDFWYEMSNTTHTDKAHAQSYDGLTCHTEISSEDNKSLGCLTTLQETMMVVITCDFAHAISKIHTMHTTFVLIGVILFIC